MPGKKEIVRPPYKDGIKVNLLWFMEFRTKQFVLIIVSLTTAAICIIIASSLTCKVKRKGIEFDKREFKMPHIKSGRK